MREYITTNKEQMLSPLLNKRGILDWQGLTQAEKVVSLIIILVPLIWMAGLYRYLGGLICFGGLYYEYKHYKKIRLGYPNLLVTSLMAFTAYQCVGLLMFSLATQDVTISTVVRRSMFWVPTTLILWYTQFHRIKVRLEPVAWAFSVLALEMFSFWFVGQVILGGNVFDPPRTLFSLLSGNASGSYTAGKGLENYLIPYRPEDEVFFGFARWSYFFVIPELAGIISAFMALIALDLRNRRWSCYLLISGLFLSIMSGTRAVWLGLPAVILLRFIFLFGRTKGYVIPLLILALCSFITLTNPIVTNAIIDSYEQTAESVSSYRADSSDVRGEIYAQTLEAIPDRLLLGYWIPGETVLPGFDLGRIGTHSFVISSLLYRLGLVGTFLFLAFWLSLIKSLLIKSHSRPLVGLCTVTLYSLLSLPMEFGVLPAAMIIVLITLII